jgi:hypothetical protein
MSSSVVEICVIITIKHIRVESAASNRAESGHLQEDHP